MTDAEYRKYLADKKIVAGIKGRKHTKGRASLSRPGDADYTSKRGDKDHHIGGKDVKRRRAPFAKKK